MKKIYGFITLILCFILVGCGGKKKDNKQELYFDDTGIAETTHIVFTTEASYELTDVFKVGTRRSAYNDKKIGETTYDDVVFYITDSFTTSERPQENDQAKIEGTKLVKKELGSVTVYAALKNDNNPEEPNRGLHCITFTFSDKPVYGIWEAENDYLDIWIESHKKDGETDAKKATMTFELKEDLTFTYTITEGYWSDLGYDNKIEAQTITGYISWDSAGLNRRDTGGEYYTNFEFFVDSDNKLVLHTGYRASLDSNTSKGVNFYKVDKTQNNA